MGLRSGAIGRIALTLLLCFCVADAAAQSDNLKLAWQRTAEFYAQGRFQAAEPVAREAVDLTRAEFGEASPIFAYSLLSLGRTLRELDRHDEAERLMLRALSINERTLGAGHSTIAINLNNLALLYEKVGRLAAAEPLYRRALEIRRAADGPEHPGVAATMNNLAALYRAQGRLKDAETNFAEALRLLEKAHNGRHADVAAAANNLAEVMRAQGRYREAEPLLRRAVETWRETLGADHPSVAAGLSNLADLLKTQGRYDEAEELLKQSISIRERRLGLEHTDVAIGLNNLASLYRSQGRLAEAERIYRRSLAIREKAFGPDHPDVARVLNNIARVYRGQRRWSEAEPLFLRALAIWEKSLGPEHPDVGYCLDNLARVYRALNRPADAQAALSRSIAIWEKTFGPDHPDFARALATFAELKASQQDYAGAVELQNRALAIDEGVFGGEHPSLAEKLDDLAAYLLGLDRLDESLSAARRAVAILKRRLSEAPTDDSDVRLSEQRAVRDTFFRLIALAERAAQKTPERADILFSESFESGQLAAASATSRAISRMSARLAAGNGDLATAVRERQDLSVRWSQLDQELTRALAMPPARRDLARESELRREMTGAVAALGRIEADLDRRFPEYGELAAQRPISAGEARALLRPGEALLVYVVGDRESFAWLVTPEDQQLVRLTANRAQLEQDVRLLRYALDSTLLAPGATAQDLPQFDTRLSHRIYRSILAPFESELRDVKRLIVVSDGALQKIPFSVLVTEPTERLPRSFADYRAVPWLVNRMAISHLPAVSSLRALRGFERPPAGSEPLIGVGDPVLTGGGGAIGARRIDQVRAMAPLPEAKEELSRIAEALRADPSALMLGARASERLLRTTDLSRARVVAFATHGLMAGELPGLREPALVLSPPDQPLDESDDGLLTATEIAELKLAAEWVILSACNTAAGDAEQAEGFSGLARAFFYAGTRAMLVSHWPVESDAAVRLTTRTFERLREGASTTRAEAVQGAMLDMIADRSRPELAHPLFWAPFVVVGEGGRN